MRSPKLGTVDPGANSFLLTLLVEHRSYVVVGNLEGIASGSSAHFLSPSFRNRPYKFVLPTLPNLLIMGDVGLL